MVEARNSPRFGSDSAKTVAVFGFIASEGRPERRKLQNTRDFAHRYRGTLAFDGLLPLHHGGDGRMGQVQIIGQTYPSPMNESSRGTASMLEAPKQKIDGRNDSDAVYVRRVIAMTDDEDLLVTGGNLLE